MNDDELRNRLARLDPQASAPVDPITSPRAQDLLERTMTSTETYVDSDAPAPRPNRRRALLLSAAAGVAAIAVVGAALAMQDDGTPTPLAKKTTITLSLPSSLAMASCVPFDAKYLKDDPVAFAGTATAVDADTATLDVTKWYRGGSAAQVIVKSPDPNTSVSLDSVSFAVGKHYLVSATSEGDVTSCGYSGEDTPQLRAAFDEAYG